VHYEGELVVVIGRQAKHLTPENALECVLGYSIGNDITERGWQSEDRTLWRAKNTDSFKPMGPWTTTGLDPMGLEVITRVNGEEVSRYETKNMIFTVVDYLVEVTKYLTLFPGDVMWMGCDGATGPIIPGDTVEVEVPGIGVLRNRVARE
jgi:2-keto-4-pentenoate hydratase/2-oxohepta-3-ene-1,7-dioic acid hydratase in catechol pathway